MDIHNVLLLLFSISLAASQPLQTTDFTVVSNGNTQVNIPCAGDTVVAFEEVTVSSSNDDCRLDAYVWLSATYLDRPGGQQTASASDLSGCGKNEVVDVTYRCVHRDQVLNICIIDGRQIASIGSAIYLRSPKFPQQYPPGKSCKAYFNANMNSTFKVLFLDVHKRPTSGCYDRLTIFANVPIFGEMEQSTICGENMFSADGLGLNEDQKYDSISVRFYSDASDYNLEHLGFLIRIEIAPDETIPSSSSVPTVPTEPTVPTQPTVRIQPTVPTEPTQPTVPTEPTVPTDSANSFDDCVGILCQNDGECIDDFNNFACDCKPGYGGRFCEDISCEGNPCQHGGLCDVTGTGIECTCTDDYMGEYCEDSSSGTRRLHNATWVVTCFLLVLFNLTH